jgi:hypothetical protein
VITYGTLRERFVKELLTLHFHCCVAIAASPNDKIRYNDVARSQSTFQSMTDSPKLTLTIEFNDPELDVEEWDEQAQLLILDCAIQAAEKFITT